MDFYEYFRRFKRLVDTNYTFRRGFFMIIIFFVLFWIFGIRFPPSSRKLQLNSADTCLLEKLHSYSDEVNNLDSTITRSYQNGFVPYVGNGFIGISLNDYNSALHIKPYGSRTLSLPIPFRPLVHVSVSEEELREEAFVSQYFKGLSRRVTCLQYRENQIFEISNVYSANRVYPSIFEQNITLHNPTSRPIVVQLDTLGWSGDPPFKTEEKTIRSDDTDWPYVVGSGFVSADMGLKSLVVVAHQKIPNAVQVDAFSVYTIRVITVVNYKFVRSSNDYSSLYKELYAATESDLTQVVKQRDKQYGKLHENAWKDLWGTGFYISHSKAEGALNGDKINATLYYVLSQSRDPLHEIASSTQERSEANSILSYSEGCYGDHHTLQARKLWSHLSTLYDVLKVCNIWLLTLEKQGCHNLLKAGAPGVMQSMVLSFGALKFRNHHLEFNTVPKDLHRDYHFRRILYGNATHVNISVNVREDNKAVLFVALDRKDKDYYACDAGCLDSPVELGPIKEQFPVKLTDPVTAILYITSDRKHAEDLHLSIHVREIFEAPAHEDHVISMHRHGSGYSTMATLFWVFLSLLIIIFHLFLFHLIYTEYFSNSNILDKYRSRKISDF